MNVFLKDEVGVPSTMGAILFNFFQLMGVDIISMGLTWSISLLSIIYLVYKIKNEKKTYDRFKNDSKD